MITAVAGRLSSPTAAPGLAGNSLGIEQEEGTNLLILQSLINPSLPQGPAGVGQEGCGTHCPVRGVSSGSRQVRGDGRGWDVPWREQETGNSYFFQRL